MASASITKKKSKKRLRERHSTSIFSIFSQEQIQEFKEAFNLLDENKDGFIDKNDLLHVHRALGLGQAPKDEEINAMIQKVPGPINFTLFLAMFSENMKGVDPEEVLLNAFACFDGKNLGFIEEDYLKECLMTLGERWSEEKAEELLRHSPVKDGRFDYVQFTRDLTHGKPLQDKVDDEG